MTFRPLSPFRPFAPFKYGTRTLASQVRALFANGEQGAIYGTDFSTLFQDAVGTVPVTAVEQQVGLRLDTSKGLVLGPELVTNGDFSNGLTGWANASTGTGNAQVLDGAVSISGTDGTNRGFIYQVLSGLVIGRTYKVELNRINPSGSFNSGVGNSAITNLNVLLLPTNSGVVSGVFVATATTLYVMTYTGLAGGSGSIDNISVRELPGNHLVQATATKRAYVSRRVNLLTASEFPNGVTDAPLRNGVTAATMTGYAGALEFTASGNYAFKGVATVAGQAYRISCVVQMQDGLPPVFPSSTPAAGDNSFAFVLGGGTVDLSDAQVTDLGGGMYRVSKTAVSAAGNTNFGVSSYAGQIGRTFKVTAYSCTLAIDSHLPYQSVNTATDYDADPSKFPTLERYDGIDDSASSSTGGGGTAGFFFSSAITVSGGAGTNRVLFSDAGTNTGYIVRINASNQLELAAGNGTAYTTVASVATLTAPVNAVVQAWDDGTNLNVRINDGVVASVARPTVSAGTAGYTIGQDNGASTGYFNGREYSTLYRKDSGLTADQRDQVRRYQLQQARFV